MDTRADEIRSEIDDVRGDLGDTLEAIGDRVAPNKVMARAKADLADRVDDVKDKVSPRRLAGRGADAVKRGVRGAVGSDGRPVVVTAERGQGQTITKRASSSASTVVDELGNAPRAARRKAEGNPLAAGLLAFAGGFFAAALLPPTDRERQITDKAKERFEPLAQGLAEAGKNVAGELESTARQSLERVKETATDAAEQVKGQAGSATGRVKGQAKASTGTVKGEARQAASQVKGRARKVTTEVKGAATKRSRPAASLSSR